MFDELDRQHAATLAELDDHWRRLPASEATVADLLAPSFRRYGRQTGTCPPNRRGAERHKARLEQGDDALFHQFEDRTRAATFRKKLAGFGTNVVNLSLETEGGAAMVETAEFAGQRAAMGRESAGLGRNPGAPGHIRL